MTQYSASQARLALSRLMLYILCKMPDFTRHVKTPRIPDCKYDKGFVYKDAGAGPQVGVACIRSGLNHLVSQAYMFDGPAAFSNL